MWGRELLDRIVRERLRSFENEGEDFRNPRGFEWSDPLGKSEVKERLMKRHHAAHPPSAVKHNPDVNKKPNYTPPEEASNNNPSLGPIISTDGANARLGRVEVSDQEQPNAAPTPRGTVPIPIPIS